ncbi:MAG: orotidine-5'-phosphate decarboxylase [Vicingaceae bacterium]
MNRKALVEQIKKKKSFLCVGLDTDLQKIPSFLNDFDDPVFEFNKRIIDATRDLVVAYKPNLAFYEAMGAKGWESLKKTIDYIPKNIFTIADAKRGDIGNTSLSYAKTFFETYNFDSVTVAPYMGSDSVTPFLQHQGKWAIVLGLTSNQGAFDFQFQKLEEGSMLFEKVLETSQKWGTEENMMYVVGATKAEHLQLVRKVIPNHFLLVPGVGAQGGSLDEVCQNGLNSDIGLLVNSSRGVIYAGKEQDFDQKAREAALAIQNQMATYV